MDIARLGVAFDTDDLRQGKAALDALVPAAKRAQTATEKLSAAAAGVATGAGGAAAGIMRFDTATAKAAAGTDRFNRAALLSGTAMRTVQGAAVSASTSIDNLAGHVTRVGNNFAQADAHVEAYKRSLAGVAPAAQGASSSLNRLGAAANDNINRMQSTPANIAAQFQDIGVTAAMGMSPLMIALQQGTQLSAAMAGGVGNLAAAFKQILSPTTLVTIALVAGAAALIQWVMNAEKSVTASERAAMGLQTYTTEMGYSREEVEKLNNVTVTFGDTMNAVFSVGMERIASAFGTTTEEISSNWQSMLADMVGNARQNIAEIYGVVSAGAKLLDRGTSGTLDMGNFFGQMRDDYRSGTKDALSFFDEVGSTARSNARARQDEMASRFVAPPKKTPKGPKSAAEKFEDLVKRAEADIATERTREQTAALADNIEAVATLTQRTKLLNDLTSKDIPLTAQRTSKIEELAAAYGRASAAANRAEALFAIDKTLDQNERALEQQSDRIGKYGAELARITQIQELFNQLQDAGVKITEDGTAALTAEGRALKERAEYLAEQETSNMRRQFAEDMRRDHEEQMWQLGREREELGMTGATLRAYRIETELLAAARAANIALSPTEIAGIRAIAEAEAVQIEAIERVAEAIDFTRETTRSFFSEWYEGIRNGENIFKSFADSVIAGLDRIVDRLLDNAITGFMDNMFSGIGGFFGGAKPNALGNAFDEGGIARFAKGGAFTNSIVSKPTLFRFASGGALGEMGEAGPEAIMPLARGRDGKLGVHVGGRSAPVINAPINITNDNRVEGAMNSADIVAMQQRSAKASEENIRRAIPQILQQYQTDGSLA